MTNTQIELLSEKGKQVMELKKTLLEKRSNPLIYSSLIQTIDNNKFEKAVQDSLVNDKCNEKEFELVLMKYKTYTNTEILEKEFTKLKDKICKELEKNKMKHFYGDISIGNGGIYIIKKLGINADYFSREFRLQKREVNKLLKGDFAEEFATLKLNAVIKDITEHTKRIDKAINGISFDCSKFYYDEASGYYNIDFKILIKYSEDYFKISPLKNLVAKIQNVFEIIDKQYRRNVRC